MSRIFLKRVKNYIFKEQLFSKGDRLVVGVSGGPDSVALVRVLLALQRNYALQLRLVHVNYGLRGQDSDRDERFVRKLAKERELPLQVYYYKGRGRSEASLRDFRYQVLEQEREQAGFDWIAVAHHKDDQVETFLLNLIRGSGLQGLQGMRPKRDRIIRPLLAMERPEILAFLKALHQAYRIDKTNYETKYLRNRIRNKLLPLMVREYSPGIKQRLVDVAEHIRVEHELVEEISKQAYNTYVMKRRGNLVLSADKAMDLPQALLRRLFRLAVEELVGLSDVTLSNFREFEKMVKSGKPKASIMKFKGLVVSKKGKEIVFARL